MRINGEDSRRSQASPEPDFDQLMDEEDGEIDRALREAVREALLRHKRLGQSVIVCEGDNVVKLPPDQIPD